MKITYSNKLRIKWNLDLCVISRNKEKVKYLLLVRKNIDTERL